MRRRKFTKEEESYLWKKRNNFTNKKLAAQLTFIYGTRWTERAIYDKIRKMVADKDKKDGPPPARKLFIYVPAGEPAIKTRDLIQAMDQTGTSLADVARLADLHIDSVRVLVRRGGIPKPFAWRVRAFYREKGVVI